MATQKTWTAYDVGMRGLRASLDDSNVLTVVQGYKFLDGNGNEIDILPDRTVSESVAWSDPPQDVQDGLTAVNNYMKDKALSKEGMS